FAKGGALHTEDGENATSDEQSEKTSPFSEENLSSNSLYSQIEDLHRLIQVAELGSKKLVDVVNLSKLLHKKKGNEDAEHEEL
ncbi:5337_t:CDS:1, partial [Paraglomus occultum]